MSHATSNSHLLSSSLGPAHNLRSSKGQYTDNNNMEASINTLTERMNALESPDRMPTFTEGTDTKAWLCQFDIHANGKGWTSPAKLAGMLPMYFNSTVAAEWDAHLPQATKDNFQLLREALIEEYRAARRWEAENTLRGRKKRHGEEVRDFVKEVRHTGQQIGLNEETLVNIVLNNLLPAARAMITTTPATVDEILATPVGTGEVPLASTSAMPGISNEQFAHLLDVLDKQSAQIAALQQSQAVNNIQPTEQTQQGDNLHQPSYHNPPRHNNQPPPRHFNSSRQPPRQLIKTTTSSPWQQSRFMLCLWWRLQATVRVSGTGCDMHWSTVGGRITCS